MNSDGFWRQWVGQKLIIHWAVYCRSHKRSLAQKQNQKQHFSHGLFLSWTNNFTEKNNANFFHKDERQQSGQHCFLAPTVQDDTLYRLGSHSDILCNCGRSLLKKISWCLSPQLVSLFYPKHFLFLTNNCTCAMNRPLKFMI